MRSLPIAACHTLVTTAATAQTRPYTPELTCAAVRGIIAGQGAVVLATSPLAYERVFFESSACRGEVTFAPAFEPTRDDPSCFAGFRCKQRNNDGTGTKSAAFPVAGNPPLDCVERRLTGS